MRVPLRFILALPCGVLVGIGFFIGLLYAQLGVPTESSRWIYEIIQKKEARAAAMTSPRLLVVAGSSALYGINAQRIEERTGYPTMNMAGHAGLGLDYLLYMTPKTARPGDTVLLAIEYELYSEDLGTDTRDDYVLARDPGYFRQLSWVEKIDMATRIPFKRIQKGLSNRVRAEKPPRAHRPYDESVDDNGDEVNNWAANRQPSSPSIQLVAENLIHGIPSTDRPGFNAVRDFVTWARGHQVTVLATFPNIIYHPEYDEPNAREAIKTIADFYASQGVPVIGTAREAMLPEDDFFDTLYHLTHEAALNRTDRLVPELEPYLKTSPR
jgi:hypothetical protein